MPVGPGDGEWLPPVPQRSASVSRPDINRAIVDTFGAAGYPVPEEHMHMRQAAVTQAG